MSLWVGAMGGAGCDGYQDCVSQTDSMKRTGRILLVSGLVAIVGGLAVALFLHRTRFTEEQ